MAGRDFNVAIAVRHTDNLKNLMTDVKSYRVIVNKMLQYPPKSYHLDTFILIASSLKIGGNVAQTASFVQEIHDEWAFWPSAESPKCALRTYYEPIQQCRMAGQCAHWDPSSGLGKGHFSGQMNGWLPGCKRLHPGLQIYATAVAMLCVWAENGLKTGCMYQIIRL